MKDRIYHLGLFLILITAAMLCACTNVASTEMPSLVSKPKQAIHIRFSTWHPADNRECKTVWIPMLEELKNRSDGRITYTTYFGGALGTGEEHYDIVANGFSEMGYFTATWTPDLFPLTDVLSMAAWIDGKDVAVDIGKDVYERFLHLEFLDVEVIELNGCIQALLWTKRPIYDLKDIKGLRIRSPGGQQTLYIQALGAEPVFMPLNDVYSAIEEGTVDGVVTCPPLFLDYELYEVANFGVLTTFGCVSEGLIMNADSWKTTSDDLKLIIEDVCSNPYRTTGGLTREVYKEIMKEITGNGVELFTLPPEEAQDWFVRFQDTTKEWIADLESKGLPAREVVDMFNEECEKRGIDCVAYPDDWK